MCLVEGPRSPSCDGFIDRPLELETLVGLAASHIHFVVHLGSRWSQTGPIARIMMHYVLLQLSCIVIEDCPFFRLGMLSITTAIDQHAYVQLSQRARGSCEAAEDVEDVPVFPTELNRWLCATAGSSTTRCTARASRLSSWKGLHWKVVIGPYHLQGATMRNPGPLFSLVYGSAPFRKRRCLGISSDNSQALKCRYCWDMNLFQRETDPTGIQMVCEYV